MLRKQNLASVSNSSSRRVSLVISAIITPAILAGLFIWLSPPTSQATAAPPAINFAVLVPGPFIVNGTGSADLIEFRRTTGGGLDDIEYRLNGVLTTSVPVAGVSDIVVNGLDGADTLTVNYGGSGGFFAIPIAYNGGNPTAGPGDKLIVTGGTFAKATNSFTNAHDGNIVYDVDGNVLTTADQATISYTGLEPIDMTGSTITDLVFNLPTGTVGAQLQDDGAGAGNNKSQIASTNGTFETTDFTVPTNSLTVNGGGGADTITTAANFSGDFNAALTINGTQATDGITLNALTLGNAGANSGALSVTGFTILGNNKIDTTPGTAGNVSFIAGRNIDFGVSGGIKTSSGNITLQANTAGTATGDFDGIFVNNVTITTATGAISLTGHGGSDAATQEQHGIILANNAVVEATGSGSINLNGTGGQGTFFNTGIFLRSNSKITSTTGSISLTGTGGVGSVAIPQDQGVSIAGSQVIASGNAAVTITGTGGTSGHSEAGTQIGGTGTKVTSGGTVQITGNGGGTSAGANNMGLRINGGALVSGTGGVELLGQGGPGTAGAIGVEVDGFNGTIVTSAGPLQITGTGGGNSNATSSHGVVFFRGAQITTTGSAPLTINGTGGPASGSFNRGIVIQDSQVRATSTGTVSIGANSSGVTNRPALQALGAGTVSAASAADNISLASNNGATVSLNVTTPGGLLLSSTSLIVGDFSLTNASNSIARLAANIRGTLNLVDSMSLNVTTVFGIAGINPTALGQTVTLSAPSFLVSQPVIAFVVSLTSGSTITQTAAGWINANSLSVQAAGLVDLTTAPNNVGGLTAFNSLSGASMAYTDINSFAVGAVAGGDGFNTVNGNITLQANSGVLGLNGGVNAGNATVTLITPGNISRAGSGAIAAATVNLNLSSGSAAHTWTITPTHFTDAGFNGVPYSAVTNLTIQGGTGNETYNVTPSSNTTFNLHGNNPTPPASPGDSLFVDFTGTTGPVVNKTSTPNGFQGAFTFGNRKPVNFTTIETLNCTSPTPITMTCPSSIAKFTDPGQRSAIVTPVKPVASGGCANPSVTGVRNDGKPLNAPYPVGPTIITWTATDGINSTSCAQTIVVMAPSGGRRQP